MEKPFFVMMWNQAGDRIVPLTTGDDEIMQYASAEEAKADMSDHPFAQAMGFEVFEMGCGL